MTKIIQKVSHVKWLTKLYRKWVMWNDQQNHTWSELCERTNKIIHKVNHGKWPTKSCAILLTCSTVTCSVGIIHFTVRLSSSAGGKDVVRRHFPCLVNSLCERGKRWRSYSQNADWRRGTRRPASHTHRRTDWLTYWQTVSLSLSLCLSVSLCLSLSLSLSPSLSIHPLLD